MFKQLIFITLASLALIQTTTADPLKQVPGQAKLANAGPVAKKKVIPFRIHFRGYEFQRLYRIDKKGSSNLQVRKRSK